MGDYLKIAADRAGGRTAPTIQPRIASLFEPPSLPLSARFTRFPTMPATPEQQPSFPAEPSVEPSRTQITDVQQSLPTTLRMSREALPPTELGQQARAEDRIAKAAPALPSIRRKTDPKQPTVGGFEHHEEVTTPAATTPPARVRVRPARTQEEEPQAPVRVEPAPIKNPAPALRPEIKQEVHARTVEHQAERSVVKEIMERVRRVQTEQPPMRPLNSAVGPVRAIPAFHETGFSTSEPVEDSRPVINVVIGRVSVNAVTERPVMAAKPKQPAAPMLSLDRYLEQRRGQS